MAQTAGPQAGPPLFLPRASAAAVRAVARDSPLGPRHGVHPALSPAQRCAVRLLPHAVRPRGHVPARAAAPQDERAARGVRGRGRQVRDVRQIGRVRQGGRTRARSVRRLVRQHSARRCRARCRAPPRSSPAMPCCPPYREPARAPLCATAAEPFVDDVSLRQVVRGVRPPAATCAPRPVATRRPQRHLLPAAAARLRAPERRTEVGGSGAAGGGGGRGLQRRRVQPGGSTDSVLARS
eukprot:1625465-Prymnesium_polylepis.1